MSETSARPLAIARWLFAVAGLVFIMVVIGGITRLTESGLSITEWKPVTGAIPPLTDADWQAEFAKYKNSSQYVLMNAGMDLSAFKHIYFWEFFHRLFGRLIGLAFVVPLIWFGLKRAIPSRLTSRLIILLILGAMQGLIGWLMVKSGLVDRVNVQPVMLAAHLTMALLLLSALIWTAFDCLEIRRDATAPLSRLTPFAGLAVAVLFFQIIWGALTAGMRAGQVASTWPLMNDHVVPEGIDWADGALYAATHDPFLVHFIHRWWAWVVVGVLIILGRRLKAQGARRASIALHSSFGTQILLGIATVMTGVNIAFAVLHQAVGALVVISTIWGLHVLGRDKSKPSQS
jgi:cytochrome c oxidase assembly protein subunit 15